MANRPPAFLPAIPEPRFEMGVCEKQNISFHDQLPSADVLKNNSPSSRDAANFIAIGFCSQAELISYSNRTPMDEHELPSVVLGICRNSPNKIYALAVRSNSPIVRFQAFETPLELGSKKIQPLIFYNSILALEKEVDYQPWRLIHEFAQFLLSPDLEMERFDNKVKKYYGDKERLPSLPALGVFPAGGLDSWRNAQFLNIQREFKNERTYFRGISAGCDADENFTNVKFEDDFMFGGTLDGEDIKLPGGHVYNKGQSDRDMRTRREGLIRAIERLNADLN